MPRRRIRTGFLTRLALIVFMMAMMAGPTMKGLGRFNPFDPMNASGNAYKHTVTLPDTALRHILDGDAHGGGHRHGTAAPCKSEFPATWDDAHIESAITNVANDNKDWHQGQNGYYTTDAAYDGIKMRVVVNQARDEVVTAYPIDAPRNPCPHAANDNDSP